MIRSEIIENSEGPARLVEPCRDIITAAREKLLSTRYSLDRRGFRRAYLKSLAGGRNYAVSAYYPRLSEIGPDLTITGVQLSPDGVYQGDLVSLTLPSDTILATPLILKAWGSEIDCWSTEGLQRLADELRAGTHISHMDYYASLPPVQRHIY